MWQIVVLAAAFAAVTRSGVEATSDYFHFGDLKVLTDMFVDCDTVIVSDGGIVLNIHDVSQPVRVYNEWEEFEKFKSIAEYDFFNQTEHYMRSAQIHRMELKGRKCKAQILIFYRSLVLEQAEILQGLSSFRYHESVYRYSAIIHKANYKMKTNVSGFHRRAAQVKIPHFYHVTMSCENEHYAIDRSTGEGSLVRRHYRGWTRCHLNSFKTACVSCEPYTLVEYPCTLDDQTKCPRSIAEDGQSHGSIASNERQLAVAHRSAYVLVIGMRLELGTFPVVSALMTSRRWSMYREFIKSFQEKFGQHAVLTKKDELIFPEEIFFDSVLTYHDNLTVEEWIGGYGNVRNFHEAIWGPGLLLVTIQEYETVPVGTVSYSFMTCSNISFIPRTGIFSAPFDGPTWFWTLATVVAVSVALLMAMKKMNVGAALFLLVFTMVRLLLENHSGVSRDLVRRKKLMAYLILLMALGTIILSNGYKGVLTSDLSMAPIPASGTTFEQVLESNWSMSWHTTSIVNKEKMPIMVQNLLDSNMLSSLYGWVDLIERLVPTLNVLTESGKKEYRLALKIGAKIEKPIAKVIANQETGWKAEKEIFVEDKFCSCNGSYWLIETGTFVHPDVPGGCETLSANENFFVSEELIGNRSVSWSTHTMRPGPVFRSIHRGVEAGLYHWLNNIRRSSHARGVYVKDNFLMRMLNNEPKPLTMESLLISSTLWLHGVLSLITVAVLVCEILWNGKKRIYFAVRGWIARLKGWWLRKVAGKRQEAVKKED